MNLRVNNTTHLCVHVHVCMCIAFKKNTKCNHYFKVKLCISCIKCFSHIFKGLMFKEMMLNSSSKTMKLIRKHFRKHPCTLIVRSFNCNYIYHIHTILSIIICTSWTKATQTMATREVNSAVIKRSCSVQVS